MEQAPVTGRLNLHRHRLLIAFGGRSLDLLRDILDRAANLIPPRAFAGLLKLLNFFDDLVFVTGQISEQALEFDNKSRRQAAQDADGQQDDQER